LLFAFVLREKREGKHLLTAGAHLFLNAFFLPDHFGPYTIGSRNGTAADGL